LGKPGDCGRNCGSENEFFFSKQRQKLCLDHLLSRRCPVFRRKPSKNQQQLCHNGTPKPHTPPQGHTQPPWLPTKAKKLKPAYAKQMALRRETGSSASDDEPRRGDAQDKRRIGPSPDRLTQVIVHRPRVASTSQQEEITTKTFEHAGTEPTNMTLPQPNLGHHHRRCLTRLHPEHPDLRLASCQPRSHVCLSRRSARRGSPPSRRRPQEGTRRRIDAVVRSHRIKAFTRRREPEAARVVELHDRPPRRTATSTDAARSGFRPEQTNHHILTRPDSETKIEKR
jgi:hypothetical protein